MSAPSLYRRHRPRTFADVVGQEHVVRTLRNAIQQGKVHHAYLFVGSRGTGKTSMAKILAASLNCERGPTVEPCGVCESCRAIANATSLDVIEMDAASNNSVDDIRDLREKVAYAPVSGRHKVYILDEAHMLSTAAWNAFLKTLEEPPPNTIFVLATTEAAKVLPTVVDRCHRFDFSRPTVPQIVGVLRRAADAESIEIPDEALALVGRAATGSFRDALGTLEQLMAYTGSTIALDDVLAVLGAADSELLLSVVDAVASGDAREALLAAARLADSGRDVGRFFTDLETHARGLMVVQTLGGAVPAELSITPERDERLAEQAARVPAGDVVRLLDLIAVALRAMKDGSDARTQLELTLVKAAVPEHDAGTTALLSRIERLEARLAGGVLEPARPAGAERTASAETPPAERANPVAAASTEPSGSAGAERDVSAETSPAERAKPVAAASAGPSGSAGTEGDVSAETHLSGPARPEQDVSAETAPAESAGSAQAAVAVAAGPLDLPRFVAIWPAVLERLEGDFPKLAACLGHARPAALTTEELTLAWGASSAFLKRIAEDPANREAMIAAIRTVTGTGLRLTHELRDDEEAGGNPAERPLSEEELIARFMAEFDAEELPPDDPQTSEA